MILRLLIQVIRSWLLFVKYFLERFLIGLGSLWVRLDYRELCNLNIIGWRIRLGVMDFYGRIFEHNPPQIFLIWFFFFFMYFFFVYWFFRFFFFLNNCKEKFNFTEKKIIYYLRLDFKHVLFLWFKFSQRNTIL